VHSFFILVLPFYVGGGVYYQESGLPAGGGCNGTRNPSIGGYFSYLFLEYFELLNIYPIGIAALVPVRWSFPGI